MVANSYTECVPDIGKNESYKKPNHGISGYKIIVSTLNTMPSRGIFQINIVSFVC